MASTTAAGARDRVLVVEDEDDIRALVVRHLRARGYDVLEASDGPDGLRLARAAKPDLVLLDIRMPGLDGYAVCREIARWGAAAPPVIFLTAQADVSARVVGLDAGATDYVVKPFAGAELVARVRAALRTKAVTDALSAAAATDPLTGLLNRRQLDARAAEAIALARRGHPLTCLLIDVDGFKRVNDTFGHQAGDDLLREVAAALRRASRLSDVVGRYGGDEFVVLLTEREPTARRMADRIVAALADRRIERLDPDGSGGQAVQVAASVGLAVWREGMETPADLYAAADEMLYDAKRRGGGRVGARP